MVWSEGDRVIVPGCGVGTVEATEILDIGEGALETYRVDLGRLGRMWVPCDRTGELGLRAPMDASQVQAVWDRIAAEEAPEKRANWNQRQRRYQEMMMSHEPLALARLVGELSAVRRRKRASRQTLSFSERRMLHRAAILIAQEVAASRGTDVADVALEVEGMIGIRLQFDAI